METTQLARRIFLIDGLGACATALVAGMVLPHFTSTHGITDSVLRGLTVLGLIFCGYSLSRYASKRPIRRWMLLVIILGNLGYCALSVFLIFTVRTLTIWGQAYLVAEIVVILGLVLAEAQIARRFRTGEPKAL
jgi:FtsH-binding integral membrane protein